MSVAHRSTVGEKIDVDMETLSTLSGNFDFSKYCCSLDSRVILLRKSCDEFKTEDKHWSFAVKRRIFSDKATPLKLCTAGNDSSIIKYTSIAPRVHFLLCITHTL